MCREESKTSFHDFEICEVFDVKMQVFSSEVETFCSQCGFTTPHEKKIKETKHYFLLRRIKQFLQRKGLNFDVMLISQVVVVYNAVNESADSDKEKCIVTFQYSETPPYGRLGNTVTSLLRPPFFGLVKRSYIFL